MGAIYTRDIAAPETSFFLFGPRGTGKSTWLHKKFAQGYFVDLLSSSTALRYQKAPDELRHEVLALPKERWIIVDAVQKVPPLLDEVHFLMEREGHKKFVLSGSSARKLKRGGANLLAGRALLRKMFPLNAHETEHTIPLEQSIDHGMLPMSVNLPDGEQREEFLLSYVETYINEEIKYEGLVRQIGAFARFLEVASLSAGTQINVSALARNVGLGRDTVRGYFSIFEDTLLGTWLQAYRPRAKVKEVLRPKFYWFDSGVLNAAAQGFTQPMPREWKGVLLEHLIYNEILSFLEYSRGKGSLGFWKVPSGAEIDFIWWYGARVVGIEVKVTERWRPEHLKGIRSFSSRETQLAASYVVYLGDRELRVEGTWVLPARKFLRELHQGNILAI
jgi:predicted AAA+ superfamily ATPase